MALWHRIKPSSKFQSLAAHHFLSWRPNASVRCFAAPVQAKPKPSADSGEPRLNTAITASVVRLVTDEGHGIVPLKEALHRAMRLNLDLVEVQRTANPPVCKILDYHKEKFRQEIKEKERVKSKSAVTLRNGENKEIRFKAKTEPKDLKMKAETITRLMERGYRVKCTAIPAGKEDGDLGGLLSRLLSLIEDVCVVESGPHVDTRQAYVIVRHVKFATKKSGKKVSKVVDAVNRVVHSSVTSTSAATSSLSCSQEETPAQVEEEWESVASCSESENDLFSDEVDLSTTSSSLKAAPKFSPVSADNGPVINSRNPNSKAGLASLKAILESSKEKTDKRVSNGSASLQPELSSVESNRYGRRSEVKVGFNQMRPAQRSNINVKSNVPSNQGRMQPQLPMNEFIGRVQVDSRSEQSRMGASDSPRLGIFNTSKSAGTGEQKNTGVSGNPNAQTPSYGIFSAQKAAADSNEQRRFGGATIANPSGSRSPETTTRISGTSKTLPSFEERESVDEATMGKPGNPASVRPSYGIFSGTKPTASDNQRKTGDATVDKPRNPSSSTSRFGIFSTTKTAASEDQRN